MLWQCSTMELTAPAAPQNGWHMGLQMKYTTQTPCGEKKRRHSSKKAAMSVMTRC